MEDVDKTIKLVAITNKDEWCASVYRLYNGQYRVCTAKCTYVFTKDGAQAFIINILALTGELAKIELVSESGFIVHSITFSSTSREYTHDVGLISRMFDVMVGFVSVEYSVSCSSGGTTIE